MWTALVAGSDLATWTHVIRTAIARSWRFMMPRKRKTSDSSGGIGRFSASRSDSASSVSSSSGLPFFCSALAFAETWAPFSAISDLVGKPSFLRMKNGNPDEEETELAESDRDAENRPIPSELSDVFHFRGIMNRQLRAIAVLMTWVQVAKSDPATSAVQMNQLFFQLRDAKETLLVGLPHAVCPYCKGKGCKSEPANRVWCQGRGWLIKDQWAGIPEERRK